MPTFVSSSDIERINIEICKWWNKHCHTFKFSNKLKTKPNDIYEPIGLHLLNIDANILFVGLNPSGDSPIVSPPLNCIKFKKPHPSNSWFGPNPYYLYYKIFYKLDEYINGTKDESFLNTESNQYIWRPKWEHIDLFACRGTKS